MIYYVTKVNMVTGDETVMTSHVSLERAVDAHTSFTVANTDENTTFRIDTVLTNEEVRAANARIKLDANRRFGRAKMDHEEGYPDTDSMRGPRHSSDFTMTELFGKPGLVAGECAECGASVANYGTHVAWHNRLLP